MSDLTTLAARFARYLAGSDEAITITVTDGGGSTTVSSPATVFSGRKVNEKTILSRIGRIMAKAHKGATVEIVLDDIGRSWTMNAEGGAFDERGASDPFVTKDGLTSPAVDMRLMTVGVKLTEPCRAILVVGAGTIEVRTAGTPGEFQTPFQIGSGMYPIRIFEIGPGTTATQVFALY